MILRPLTVPGLGVLACSLATLFGCTPDGGAMLFMLGVGRGEKIEAEFELTTEPVLILVDDPAGQVDWPPARRHLAEELGQELLRQKAATRIVPPATLDRLRQTQVDFDKRGAREIGQLAGARQVIWIEIREYLGSEDISDAMNAAFIAVTVKVIDTSQEQSRSRVRLYPTGPEGRALNTSLDGATVARLKRRDDIARELSERLSVRIAKLFYDYRLGDFESAP